MGDTPRTDAYEFALLQFGIAPQEAETDNNGPILSINRHARTLERELTAEKERSERLKSEMHRYLPIIERLEKDAMLWMFLTEGTGIATANGYRAALGDSNG